MNQNASSQDEYSKNESSNHPDKRREGELSGNVAGSHQNCVLFPFRDGR
jgi:hypothetical protein